GDMAIRRKRRVKREPVLDTIGSLFHLRLSEADRAGGAPGRAGGNGGAKSEARAKRKRRRWLPQIRVRRLAYWSMVLGLWGILALGVLFIVFSLRLPAWQELVVPQRPPSISIVGLDGHAIATRGEMG